VLELRFGKQLHTRVLRGAESGVVLEPEAVAAYVAKYSCKGSHQTITRAGALRTVREALLDQRLAQ
jgi:hypothetical protein